MIRQKMGLWPGAMLARVLTTPTERFTTGAYLVEGQACLVGVACGQLNQPHFTGITMPERLRARPRVVKNLGSISVEARFDRLCRRFGKDNVVLAVKRCAQAIVDRRAAENAVAQLEEVCA